MVAADVGSRATAPICIVEAKVFAQLDDKTKRDEGTWYLNTGATNHMSGCRITFSHLDFQVQGSRLLW